MAMTNAHYCSMILTCPLGLLLTLLCFRVCPHHSPSSEKHVTCGSAIKLTHIESGGKYMLHSDERQLNSGKLQKSLAHVVVVLCNPRTICFWCCLLHLTHILCTTSFGGIAMSSCRKWTATSNGSPRPKLCQRSMASERRQRRSILRGWQTRQVWTGYPTHALANRSQPPHTWN